MEHRESNLPLWLTLLTLQEQATRDWLTGLYNRRYFEETLSDHIEIARRYKRDLSLVLFDIDDFKQINDIHGHTAGDEALRRFADHLKSSVRRADIVCRFGGDEFAVILPETGHDEAWRFVERIAGGIAGRLSSPESDPAAATFSVTGGVAALPSDNLVADADRDLLARKKR